MDKEEQSPIIQINNVIREFRVTLKEYAMDFVALPLAGGVSYEDALVGYLKVVYDSDDFNTWRKHLKAIVDDCERGFGMERWLVRSCMGFRLEDEIKVGFKAAWKEMEMKITGSC
jgi:hypothetical protein